MSDIRHKLGSDIIVSATSNFVYLFIDILLYLTLPLQLQTLVSSNVVSVKVISGVSL